MDLKQLEYFVTVAELGGFSKAAVILHIAQPALSRQVRLLEVELKQTLLYRTGRGVSLTEAGKGLLAHAKAILERALQARDELQKGRRRPVGRVAVAAPATVARAIAVPLVRRFRTQFPDATIRIAEGLSVNVQEWLMTGRVDIGLVYDPVPTSGIETTPLLDEELWLVCPPQHLAVRRSKAVPLRDVPRYPLIIPRPPNSLRLRVDTELAKLGVKPTISLEIDGVYLILDLVRDGHGYAVLPENALRVYGKPHKLVTLPIVRPRLRSQLTIAISAQRPKTPVIQGALDLISELAAKMLGS